MRTAILKLIVEGCTSARYTYDAWGNTISVAKLNGDVILPTATEIAYLNPIRYRGYYFDQESGLYYLKSRYYDPQVRRFINPDSIIFLPGVLNHNIVAYCNNNPVNMIDMDGHYSASLSDNPGNDDRYEYYKAKKEQAKKKKQEIKPQPGPAPKPSSPPKPSSSPSNSGGWAEVDKVLGKVADTMKLPFQGLYVSVDGGYGFGGGFSAAGLEVDAVAKSTVFSFKMGMDPYLGSSNTTGASVSAGGVPLFNGGEEIFTDYGCSGKSAQNRSGCQSCYSSNGINVSNPSVGASLYAGYGGSIELGFDLNYVSSQFDKIWS